jgi:hypothetical protein
VCILEEINSSKNKKDVKNVSITERPRSFKFRVTQALLPPPSAAAEIPVEKNVKAQKSCRLNF